MLDNPLSQIERTKDAYMGRPQELQKRANMTKELVDLLAMQQLKKDLDAVKRNQAMQAQGNPATIKEQMQQGLMGEYRQQAAKEMGVGPSEADTVARAQQGMPQGAPQQMPQQQMAQGVMSQARPVQLAGGGIVAFANGSEDEGPVEAEKTVSYAELASELGTEALEWAKENPVDAALLGISFMPAVGPALGLAGKGALGAFRIGKKGYDMLKANPTARSLATKVKDLAVGAVTKPAMKSKQLTRGNTEQPLGEAAKSLGLTDDAVQAVMAQGRAYSPVKGIGLTGAALTAKNLLSDDEAEAEAEAGISDATLGLVDDLSTSQEDTPASGIMMQGIPQTTDDNAVDVDVDADGGGEEAPLSGLAAITKAQTDLFTEDMPEFTPPAPSEKLRGAIDEGIMSLDDARAESAKREERALELMGMGPDGQSRKDFEEQLAGLAALRDKNAGTQRRRDLIEFLGAGFSQGAEKYVEQEDARRARDDKYLTDRKAIQNTRMELQKVAGQEAVDSYDNALQSYLTTRSNAVRDLSNLEGQDREDYRASYNAGMNNMQMRADILNSLSANERSALDRAVSGRNADANILRVAFEGVDKQKASLEAMKQTEIYRLVGPKIAQKDRLGAPLTDEEDAAYAAAEVKVIDKFAEVQGAIANLEADILKRVSQSVTGEDISSSSDAGARIAQYTSAP